MGGMIIVMTKKFKIFFTIKKNIQEQQFSHIHMHAVGNNTFIKRRLVINIQPHPNCRDPGRNFTTLNHQQAHTH